MLAAPARDLMLVDLDAFYVSVERRRDPSLVGLPVIVGGVPGERGVVASASYEARGYGVHAGMPLARAADLCPKAVFLHGDHAAYEEASAEVMALLRAFAPRVEPVSLDEAFLDVTGCDRLHLPLVTHAALGPAAGSRGGGGRGGRRGRRPRAWIDAAETLHDEVLEKTGLSVSIGIGGTRTVAAVAAALAKPAGALEVPRGEEAAFLAGLPLEALPGVGPRTREALARFNLHTIGDLSRIPEDLLEETFGRIGLALSRRARGLEDDDGGEVVSLGRAAPKSVSRETSFARDTADRALVAATLSYLAQRATAALRRERMLCGSVAVKLRYSDFRTVEARRRLDAPSDRDRDVLEAVEAAWPARWDRRVRLRLVGVALVGLVPAGERQLDLFDDAPGAGGLPAGEKALDAALDRLRARHGFGAVVRGRAIEGLSLVDHDERGFRLRTPACSA
jgi:DNA polymerase-4